MQRHKAYVLAFFIFLNAAAAAQDTLVPHPQYALMVQAAEKTALAQRILYSQKLALGLFDPVLDPARTGLIGVEYSPITTTIGSLKAKRISTNPDFAAYVVRELSEHGIARGDSVLVTMTGSFPALNLAVLIALETLQVPSLRFCSIGSSSFGANQEDFTWLDMEMLLCREGVLSRRSDFVTLGGTGDVGGGIPPASRRRLKEKATQLGYKLLKTGSLQKQTALRRGLIGSPRSYAALINIGGNQAVLGKGRQGRELPGGWIAPSKEGWEPERSDDLGGIIFDFLASGVPVLNLLRIEDIAKAAGLPTDTTAAPVEAGRSPVYFVSPAAQHGR